MKYTNYYAVGLDSAGMITVSCLYTEQSGAEFCKQLYKRTHNKVAICKASNAGENSCNPLDNFLSFVFVQGQYLKVQYALI